MFLSTYNLGKKEIKEEKTIINTGNSYAYWKDILFEKCIRIFEWKGIPFPQKEIEIRALAEGYCGIVDDAIKGLMVATGGMSGPTQYWDEFTDFTYSAATAMGGTKKIDKNCVIINNTTLRNSIIPLIERYASLLAHADVSLKCALVNLRNVDVFSAEDNGTADSVQEYYNKLYAGEPKVIIDDGLTDGIKNIANTHSSGFGVKESIDARNDLLRSFYNEIGVNYSRDKKERMIVDEVASNNQMLLLNVNDMLKQRKEAVEKMNNIFGLKASVDFSEEYKLLVTDINDGGADDETD